MITRRDFIEQFGQDPVDLFGPDWRNYVQYFIEEKNKTVDKK